MIANERAQVSPPAPSAGPTRAECDALIARRCAYPGTPEDIWTNEAVHMLRRYRDATPTANPCAKIFEHKWLDPHCVEHGCQSLAPAQASKAVKIEPDEAFLCAELRRMKTIATVAAAARIESQAATIKALTDLLTAAKCPSCDGSGSLQVGTQENWHEEQCEWCFLKNAAIASGKPPPEQT
jgi:hypothetical protein